MDFVDLLKTITPDIYKRLKTAVELGKWSDGRMLTTEQKELTMQALIRYEHHYFGETDRVGYIDRGHKTVDEVCDAAETMDDAGKSEAIKWR